MTSMLRQLSPRLTSNFSLPPLFAQPCEPRSELPGEAYCVIIWTVRLLALSLFTPSGGFRLGLPYLDGSSLPSMRPTCEQIPFGAVGAFADYWLPTGIWCLRPKMPAGASVICSESCAPVSPPHGPPML